jgi:excisionase family DNA binding protein
VAELLNIPLAARRLGIGEDAVLAHIRAGRLRAVNVGAGPVRPRWRITEEALEQFVASRTSAPTPPAKRTRAKQPEVIQFFS